MMLFGVKCILRFPQLADAGGMRYEERVTLHEATSFGDAVIQAEKHANSYAEKENGEYLGFADAYKLYDSKMKEGMEVYSCMRKSHLEPEDYIDYFYDTGDECGGFVD